MYSARNKAELVNTTAWSLTNYGEWVLGSAPNVPILTKYRAERVLAEWEELVERSAKVYHSLNEETKPAYFELVYMLCLMQYNLNNLYIAGVYFPFSISGNYPDTVHSCAIQSIRFPG